MNARWTFSLAALAAALLCGGLPATAAAANTGQNWPAMQGSAEIIRGSTLMGTTVLDPQGQELGKIKDVLLGAQSGQATFVVLDAVAPGSGHAMLIVPYQALWVSFNPLDHRRSVLLDLRPDQLRAAPQIQNDQWEMLQNPQFLEEARNFYQIRTYTAARPIDSPSATSMPAPSLAPQPCVNSEGSGWTPDLEGFYSE
jgi:sporulation protein YlmC with PRC-barrel domain